MAVSVKRKRSQSGVQAVTQVPERRQEASTAGRIRSAPNEDRLRIQALPPHRLQSAGIFGPAIELTAEPIEVDHPPIVLLGPDRGCPALRPCDPDRPATVDAVHAPVAGRNANVPCTASFRLSCHHREPGLHRRPADRLALLGMTARGLLLMVPEETLSRQMCAGGRILGSPASVRRTHGF